MVNIGRVLRRATEVGFYEEQLRPCLFDFPTGSTRRSSGGGSPRMIRLESRRKPLRDR